MNYYSRIFLFTCLLLVTSFAGEKALAAPWQSKVDPFVLNAVDQGEAEFLVFMRSQADLGGTVDLQTKLEKGRFVYETLTHHAAQSQRGITAVLDRSGVTYQQFWVANFIWIRGDSALLQSLALRQDVERILANPKVGLNLPDVAPQNTERSPQGVEPNITLVGAPSAWAAGITGAGAVIAGQDTGYQWDHPALKAQYRGWDGAAADHDYNWHDAIHVENSECPADSPAPCDDDNHGTHTMGTMMGDDGGSNQIGIAPGARWIGCRNMNAGYGTPASYSECFQWFIAPTPIGDSNGDPAYAPDVINNSWYCPPLEGCTDPLILQTVVENTRAAGIVVVASAGNAGPGCSTVKFPPAFYEASFSIGATDNSDVIANFSSRGPVTIDGSNRLKPDVTAPGVSIKSSIRNDSYGFFSGTSMAGPHVAGLVGLLVSAVPELSGDVDAIEAIIRDTAVPLSGTDCGTDPTAIPNNTYGYGRIDVWAAVQKALLDYPPFEAYLPLIQQD